MTEKGPEKWHEKFELSYYDFNKAANDFMLKVVRPFREKYGKEEVHKLVEKVSEEEGTNMAKRVIAKTPISNFEDFKKIIKGILDTQFKRIVTYETTENTDKKITFKINECLYAKVYNDLNESEFGYCRGCHGDFAMAKAFHPKVTLTRKNTLMQGDDHCDICYTWED